MDDFFLLDFSTTTTTNSAFYEAKAQEVKSDGGGVAKKLTAPPAGVTTAHTLIPPPRRKATPTSPAYAADEGPTLHQLKVSAVSLHSANGRVKADPAKAKGCDDLHGYDKPDGEDGSTLADFLNLLSPDPGFESACGGDCSPPPVDLSALVTILRISTSVETF
jgi:hypothetical protein